MSFLVIFFYALCCIVNFDKLISNSNEKRIVINYEFFLLSFILRNWGHRYASLDNFVKMIIYYQKQQNR